MSFRYVLVAGNLGLVFVNRRPSIGVTAESAVVRDTVGDGYEWKGSNQDASLMASSAPDSTSATNCRDSYLLTDSTARARDDEITVLQGWTELLSAESMAPFDGVVGRGPVRAARECSRQREATELGEQEYYVERSLSRRTGRSMMVTTACNKLPLCAFERGETLEVSSQQRGLGHGYRTREGALRRRGTAVDWTEANSGYNVADGNDE